MKPTMRGKSAKVQIREAVQDGAITLDAHLVSDLGSYFSYRKVHEPGWVARLFGSTLVERLEAARQQVNDDCVRQWARDARLAACCFQGHFVGPFADTEKGEDL